MRPSLMFLIFKTKMMTTKIISLLILLTVVRKCQQSMIHSTFKVCNNRNRVSSPVLKTVKAKSRIQCAAACLNTASCGSSNFIKDNGTCELLSDNLTYEDCNNVGEESSGAVLKKVLLVCTHGGRWDVSLSRCVDCDHGFTGVYCERRIMDCYEGKELGYGGFLPTLIQPINATKASMVFCDFVYGVTYIETRGAIYVGIHDIYENFNRTWDDYKHGFGKPPGEYFIGLENLHLLTTQRSTDLKLQIGYNATDKDQLLYHDFVVDNEANNYTMHYSSFQCFYPCPRCDGFGLGAPDASLNHSPFCTPDRDCGSCAKDSSSGWWFNTACAATNLHVPLGANSHLEWPEIDGVTRRQINRYLQLVLFKTGTA